MAAVTRQLIEGITGVSSRRVVGRTGGPTASGFCRGVEVTIEFDEQKYVGTGVFLFACVLERSWAVRVDQFVQPVGRQDEARRGVLQEMAAPGGGAPTPLNREPPRAEQRHGAQPSVRRRRPPARRLPETAGRAAPVQRSLRLRFLPGRPPAAELDPDREPVGRDGRAAPEVVRFKLHMSLALPAQLDLRDRAAQPTSCLPAMTVTFLGLTGPSGVLPRHYTELLLRLDKDAKGAGKDALRDWLDLFNHRFISLFYRAWEKYRFYIPLRSGAGTPRPSPTPSRMALYQPRRPGHAAAARPAARRPPARRSDAADRERHAGPGRGSGAALLQRAAVASAAQRPAAWRRMLHDYFRLPVRDSPVPGPMAPAGPDQPVARWAIRRQQQRWASTWWPANASGTCRARSASASGRCAITQFLDFLPDRRPIAGAQGVLPADATWSGSTSGRSSTSTCSWCLTRKRFPNASSPADRPGPAAGLEHLAAQPADARPTPIKRCSRRGLAS